MTLGFDLFSILGIMSENNGLMFYMKMYMACKLVGIDACNENSNIMLLQQLELYIEFNGPLVFDFYPPNYKPVVVPKIYTAFFTCSDLTNAYSNNYCTTISPNSYNYINSYFRITPAIPTLFTCKQLLSIYLENTCYLNPNNNIQKLPVILNTYNNCAYFMHLILINVYNSINELPITLQQFQLCYQNSYPEFYTLVLQYFHIIF
jgi:hypothetical protein